MLSPRSPSRKLKEHRRSPLAAAYLQDAGGIDCQQEMSALAPRWMSPPCWLCWPCAGDPGEVVRTLDYAHSSLHDVPGEVFAYERTLEELVLDSNRIRDLPRPLFLCQELRVLSVCDNDVSALPPAVSALSGLQRLDASRNALRDVPPDIKACKRLASVNLSSNQLVRLPEGLTQLVALQELQLNDVELEFLPASVGRLTLLRVLELRDNRLNSLPSSMSRLKQLVRLDIGHNEFRAWPSVLGSLCALAELWTDLNDLPALPAWIGNLHELQCFDTSNNRVSAIAPEIASCGKLVDLRLSYNELCRLPYTLGRLKHLTTLKVDHNYLDQLPETIGDASNLEELVAAHNQLDLVTPCLGFLRRLQLLDLDNNNLAEIPSELGSCRALRVLSLRRNRLLAIPPEIGHLPRIRVINLSENRLRHLPVSILNLSTLQALWLSATQSAPLVQLHREYDVEQRCRVLTCLLLPQREDQAEESVGGLGGAGGLEDACGVRAACIRFSQDLTLEDEPGVLLRAPTPYPKELRTLARQAKQAARHSAASQAASPPEVEGQTHFVNEVLSPGIAAASAVKEARVSRPHDPATLSRTNSVLQQEHCILREMAPELSAESEPVYVKKRSASDDQASIPTGYTNPRQGVYGVSDHQSAGMNSALTSPNEPIYVRKGCASSDPSYNPLRSSSRGEGVTYMGPDRSACCVSQSEPIYVKKASGSIDQSSTAQRTAGVRGNVSVHPNNPIVVMNSNNISPNEPIYVKRRGSSVHDNSIPLQIMNARQVMSNLPERQDAASKRLDEMASLQRNGDAQLSAYGSGARQPRASALKEGLSTPPSYSSVYGTNHNERLARGQGGPDPGDPRKRHCDSDSSDLRPNVESNLESSVSSNVELNCMKDSNAVEMESRSLDKSADKSDMKRSDAAPDGNEIQSRIRTEGEQLGDRSDGGRTNQQQCERTDGGGGADLRRQEQEPGSEPTTARNARCSSSSNNNNNNSGTLESGKFVEPGEWEARLHGQLVNGDAPVERLFADSPQRARPEQTISARDCLREDTESVCGQRSSDHISTVEEKPEPMPCVDHVEQRRASNIANNNRNHHHHHLNNNNNSYIIELDRSEQRYGTRRERNSNDINANAMKRVESLRPDLSRIGLPDENISVPDARHDNAPFVSSRMHEYSNAEQHHDRRPPSPGEKTDCQYPRARRGPPSHYVKSSARNAFESQVNTSLVSRADKQQQQQQNPPCVEKVDRSRGGSAISGQHVPAEMSASSVYGARRDDAGHSWHGTGGVSAIYGFRSLSENHQGPYGVTTEQPGSTNNAHQYHPCCTPGSIPFGVCAPVLTASPHSTRRHPPCDRPPAPPFTLGALYQQREGVGAGHVSVHEQNKQIQALLRRGQALPPPPPPPPPPSAPHSHPRPHPQPLVVRASVAQCLDDVPPPPAALAAIPPDSQYGQHHAVMRF